MNCFYRLVYIIVAGLLIAACGRKAAPLVSSMHTEGLHHKWKVTQAKDLQKAEGIYIDLRDVYHSGATAGCRYFSFTPKFGYHNRMQIANIGAHLLPCDNEEQDRLLRANLEAVYSFSLSGNDLQLLSKDGRTIFSATKAADDENGSIWRKWIIQQMINADNEKLVKDNAFLDLTSQPKASGTAGCNKFSFEVTSDNTYNIALKNIVATKMYCKHSAQNESVFFKVLPLVNKYQVVGNTLKLFDKDNTLLLAATASLQ